MTVAASSSEAHLLPPGEGEPVFSAPWEATAFAMAVLVAGTGTFKWSDWVRTFSAEISAETQSGGDYYVLWLQALERMLLEHGVLSTSEIDRRQRQIEDNPPPHAHAGQRVPIAIA